MKIVFFGLGSIGQKHAEILLKNYNCELFALRTNQGAEPKRLRNESIKELYSWNQVCEIKPDIAFITNPTYLHIETAIKCAEAGWHLFIEKPLSHSKDKLDLLLKIVSEKKLSTYVAYHLRFHPVIKKLKEYLEKYTFLHMRALCTSYLPDWRPNQNHLKNYSAISSKGGGVLLDLSHEIDYTGYLLGSIINIEGYFSKQSNVTIDTEDCADLLIKTEKGPANIHVNFLSQLIQREIQIDFKEISVTADLINNFITEVKKGETINRFNFPNAYNLAYQKQIAFFLENLGNFSMMNSIFEASTTLKKLLNFRDSKFS